ncbi:MAG: DUF3048 domain-containing protein [Anaerovoracaceae bacterium]|jgi:hypothetical protein
MKSKLIIIIVILVAVAAGVWFFALRDSGSEPRKSETAKAEINPLTGLEVGDRGLALGRPVVVSTDNDNSDARPQSGISSADIVYEVPIEGGGSRYEPVYYSKAPAKCGPTRSARPYIVDIARGFKAVLVNNGWSPQAHEYLLTDVVPYYAAQNRDDLFYRTDDRLIPHNQYTDLRDVRKQMKKDGLNKKVNVPSFKWLSQGAGVSGKSAKTITCNYYDRINNTYRYDSAGKVYKRYINDNKCLDLNNNRQITCSNILFQMISSHIYPGETERLEIDMTEGGRALLFTRGKVIKGHWTRKSLDSPTVFKTDDGKEMKLSPGRTWIQLVDDTVTYSYK